MRDHFDKLIKTAQVRGFPQEPIRNLSLRIVFAEFIPQYRCYNHDIQEIWNIYRSNNPELASLAKKLLMMDACGLTDEQKTCICDDYLQRFPDSANQANLLLDAQNSQLNNLAKDISKNLTIANSEYIPPITEGKSLDVILTQLAEQNPEMDTAMLKTLYQKVEQSFVEGSKLHKAEAIISWNKADIQTWASLVKNDPQTASSKEFLPEMIAVMKIANFLFTKEIAENCGNAHSLRVTQILSLLIFFLPQEQFSGKLLQINTGEGKSIITACLATILSLMGKKVDVVTSSKELARRDVDSKKKFFSIFGLSSEHNCSENNSSQANVECYKKDIVYGCVSSFQYDLLKDNKDKKTKIRGSRPYDVVVIDEVDSMCIDESSKIAMISSPLPGAAYLGMIYASLHFHLLNAKKQVATLGKNHYYVNGPFEVIENDIVLKPLINELKTLPDEQRIQPLYDINYFYTKCITNVLEQVLTNSSNIRLPAYLANFISAQKDAWVKNLINSFNFKQEEDYVILETATKGKVVSPVDFANTGSINYNTTWQSGLHQFLQLENCIKFDPENLITSYISNAGLFSKYNHSYGMSGTLGSAGTQKLLQEIYNVSCAFIPTFKPKIFHKEPDIITFSHDEHLNTLKNFIQEYTNKGRAILVICQTIKFAKELKKLLSQEIKDKKISLYCTADSSEANILDKAIDSAEVMIATNLAGRGTDLKTTQAVEATDEEGSGGLHVLLSFLPQNLRVEEQAFGRTSRQGNNGSANMIINFEAVKKHLSVDENRAIDIEYLKKVRDESQ